MNYQRIDPGIIDGLNDYVIHGLPPGGFLRAVLENNLMEALGRADMFNREAIFDICGYIYNEIPSACHGSPEIVQNWLRRFTQKVATKPCAGS